MLLFVLLEPFFQNVMSSMLVCQGCLIIIIIIINVIICIIGTFFSKINNNYLIKGIKVPNITAPIKSLQRADDVTAWITTDRSYKEVKCENKAYSTVSGSKINDNTPSPLASTHLEILRKGNFETLETECIKGIRLYVWK